MCAMMLAMTEYRFRPISTWPGDLTKHRRTSPFRAGHDVTLRQLGRELEDLRAKDVVVELAVREADLRIDGMPRARSRSPEHPGCVLSFDSKHGPLRYACDAFLHWEDNLRAITLGLESLRRVERYGITKRGEQYAGWKAIAASSQSADDARSILRDIVDEATEKPAVGFSDQMLVKLARKFSHVDAPTGSRRRWDAVQQAAQTLGL